MKDIFKLLEKYTTVFDENNMESGLKDLIKIVTETNKPVIFRINNEWVKLNTNWSIEKI